MDETDRYDDIIEFEQSLDFDGRGSELATLITLMWKSIGRIEGEELALKAKQKEREWDRKVYRLCCVANEQLQDNYEFQKDVYRLIVDERRRMGWNVEFELSKQQTKDFYKRARVNDKAQVLEAFVRVNEFKRWELPADNPGKRLDKVSWELGRLPYGWTTVIKRSLLQREQARLRQERRRTVIVAELSEDDLIDILREYTAELRAIVEQMEK